MHEARFRKSKNSKRVKDSASNFVGLEKSLTCQKCTRKFATVKGRRIHESRYCGREKAGRSRIFSCSVHDRDGGEFENVEAFKYLGSFVSLQQGDLKEIIVKLGAWEPTEKYRYAKRAPGDQRKTWTDQLEEDCSRNNMSYITLRQKAKRESKSCFNSFVEQHFLD